MKDINGTTHLAPVPPGHRVDRSCPCSPIESRIGFARVYVHRLDGAEVAPFRPPEHMADLMAERRP